MFEEGHLLCSKQDISCVRSRTSRVFHAGDISCVPNRTSRVFQAGHLLCSKQDISCVPRRTSLVFQAGHLVCSKQDISCVPSRTSPPPQNPHATFERIQPIVPGFSALYPPSWHKSRDDRLNSPKSGASIFRTLNGSKIARIAPISTIF